VKNIIHIVGASGSGTSTLGRAVEDKFAYKWLDTDDYFWIPTNPPYREVRPVEERVKLIKTDTEKYPKCVLSGSLSGWDDDYFIPLFDLVVFVYTPAITRLERLSKRESQKHGNRILPGGDMHEKHTAFIEWAGTYDNSEDTNQRSFAKHKEWLKLMLCPVLRLDGTKAIDELLGQIRAVL